MNNSDKGLNVALIVLLTLIGLDIITGLLGKLGVGGSIMLLTFLWLFAATFICAIVALIVGLVQRSNK